MACQPIQKVKMVNVTVCKVLQPSEKHTAAQTLTAIKTMIGATIRGTQTWDATTAVTPIKVKTLLSIELKPWWIKT
jgi:hypothetical protein